MKNIIRLAAAFLLLAALCAPALSESARIRTAAEEIPVAVVQDPAGETFYWIDMTQLSPESWADLTAGTLEVADDAGQILLSRALEGSSAGTVTDWPMPVADPADPQNPAGEVKIICATQAAPATAEETEAYLADIGYYTLQQDWEEEEEEPEPEPTEEPTP